MITMATAFGDDLRRKFLSAYDQGGYTLEELAESFMVSAASSRPVSPAASTACSYRRSAAKVGRNSSIFESCGSKRALSTSKRAYRGGGSQSLSDVRLGFFCVLRHWK